MKFYDILTNDDLLDALYDMHFDECTPIQQQAIPPILAGKDLIGIAQTGTGKTAAYLLPVIEKLINENYPQDNVNCVIMVPTRELAQQIDRQLEGFSYYLPVDGMAIYGGTDGHTYERQRKGLKSGADIIIATPGRLLAHMNMGYVDLSKVSFFILDEADRMLDMGFFDDIMKITSYLPKERQTMLFSATMPPKIRQMANDIMSRPVEIKLAVSKPADKICQEAVVCFENQKLPILEDLLKREEPRRIIIFASSKLKVKELAKTLRKQPIEVAEMHSDLSQTEREEVMLKFKAGRINIVVATDIISRGIDIDNIEKVINFDVPKEPEDYIHRVGRTARADKDGKALTFINEKERGTFRRIEKLLGQEVEKLNVEEKFGKTPDYSEPSLKEKSRLRRSPQQRKTSKINRKIKEKSSKIVSSANFETQSKKLNHPKNGINSKKAILSKNKVTEKRLQIEGPEKEKIDKK